MGDEVEMQKQKIMWIVRLTILAALLWAGTGLGATYYVNGDTSNPFVGSQGTYGIGNNANAGTSISAPKATINNCITAASNGDTIYIANSVASYNENYDANTGIYIAKNLILYADSGPVTITSSAASVVVLTNKTSPSVTFGGSTAASSFIINAPSTARGYYQAAAGADVTNIDVQGVTGDGYYLDNAGSLTIMGGCTLNTAANGIRFRTGSVTITGGQSNMSGTGPFLNATGGAHAGFVMTGHTLTSSANYASNEIFYITRDGDITIGGNSVSDGNTFNISSPDAFLMANWDAAGGETGSITIKNNTFTRTAPGANGSALGDIYIAGTSNISVDISYNSLTYPSNQVLALIYIRGKVSPSVSYNTILDPGYGYKDMIYIEPYTAGDKGSPIVSYNNIKTASSAGHCIAIGSESTTSGDDTYNNGEISYNTIKGPMWDLVNDIPKTVITWSDADFTAGQIVKYSNNVIYECILNTTTHQNPTNATYWTALSSHTIFYGFSTDAKIHHNQLNGCAVGVVLKGDDQNNTSGYVANNIFNRLASEAFYSTGHDGTRWHNNTVYRPDIVSAAVCFATIGSTGMAIFNNVIMAGVAGSKGIYAVDNACTSGFEATHNIVNALSGNIGLVNGTTYANWGTWTGAGYDVLSYATDPLFVNAAGGDFHILAGGPGIDGGIDVGLTTDADGYTIVNEPDIGAYDYRSVNQGNIYFDADYIGTEVGTLSQPYNTFDHVWFGYGTLIDGDVIYCKGDLGVLDLSSIDNDPTITIQRTSGRPTLQGIIPHGTPANITIKAY